MYAPDLQVGHRTCLRAAFAAGALLIFGLAGCVSELASRPDHTPSDAAPYVGVFTGKFVDGMPVYRFPTIEVVGWRSSIAPDT